MSPAPTASHSDAEEDVTILFSRRRLHRMTTPVKARPAEAPVGGYDQTDTLFKL